MLYFISYLIRGKAGAYHNALRKEISETFNTYPLHLKVPPHITFKDPFKTKTTDEVEKLLEAFAQKQASSTITLSGFGHFNNKVIYINVHASYEAMKTIDCLNKKLMELKWLNFGRYETNRKLHTTIAVRDIQKIFNHIWNFIKDDEPYFENSFDSIALLKHDGKRWNIHCEFNFQSKGF